VKKEAGFENPKESLVSISKSINQSTNQSTNQSINKSSINQQINQSTNQSIYQSINQKIRICYSQILTVLNSSSQGREHF